MIIDKNFILEFREKILSKSLQFPLIDSHLTYFLTNDYEKFEDAHHVVLQVTLLSEKIPDNEENGSRILVQFLYFNKENILLRAYQNKRWLIYEYLEDNSRQQILDILDQQISTFIFSTLFDLFLPLYKEAWN